jgi:hypothetical protein
MESFTEIVLLNKTMHRHKVAELHTLEDTDFKVLFVLVQMMMTETQANP